MRERNKGLGVKEAGWLGRAGGGWWLCDGGRSGRDWRVGWKGEVLVGGWGGRKGRDWGRVGGGGGGREVGQ